MWETQKAELRKDIRSRLKAMPEEEKRILDREIAERVLGLPEIAETKAVYGYASLSWEAGTGEILEELRAQKYIICLPKVTGETMEFFVTESEQDLSEGSFHIMEPKNGCRKADETRSEILRTAPILVPGMGFVETGARLGKGGGFYDRYLEQHAGHMTIALAYEFQILGEIPVGPYDKNVDFPQNGASGDAGNREYGIRTQKGIFTVHRHLRQRAGHAAQPAGASLLPGAGRGV